MQRELREALRSELSETEWSKVSRILDLHLSAPSASERCPPPQLESDAPKPKRKKKERDPRTQRPFDFSRYNTRHVALKIAYLGWDYHGFVVQEDSANTVEHHLFEALLKTKLVESRSTSNYSRCGRTDKGVSAFGQVIAIDLRTNLLSGSGVIQRPDGTAHQRKGNVRDEIDYLHVLNRVLPEEIRVLAWTPVDPSFNARFDTRHRTYKYFFPAGDLDVGLMNEAAQKFVGTHDFRNFCKMDVANGVVKHVRTIRSAEVQRLGDGCSAGGYEMYEFTISGLAFLYHQVRCIMAILLLIGRHKEEPEIIDQLLDVESQPCKPQYAMAMDFPLVLYDCAYEGIQWIYDEAAHQKNINLFQNMWTGHSVRAAMMGRMLDGLTTAPMRPSNQCIDPQTEDEYTRWCDVKPPTLRQATSLTMGLPSKNHKPLFDRQTAESLENRIEHFAKRRKVDASSEEDPVS